MTQSRDHFFITHTRTIVALLFGLSFSVVVAYATPPGSAYTPAETLDPTCAPGDVNCTVDIGIGNLTGSTSSVGTETWLGTSVAGLGTASTLGTIFLGIEAGKNATGASQSIFFGYQAGIGATNASDSHFFGGQAGYLATGAHRSNFFGGTAGSSATNASNSNFFGYQAGYQATYASQSNFFGYQAGYQATNALLSNFIGEAAGSGATNAELSNFIGYRAGSGATNASRSIFIGVDSGYTDTVNNGFGESSILIGNYTRTGGFKNSIAIGQGTQNSAIQQFNIGNVLYGTGIYSSNTPSSSPTATGNVGIANNNPTELFTLGTTGSRLGVLSFAGSTSGKVIVQPAVAAGTWTMTLPTTGGTSGYVLSTDGNGVTSWIAPAIGSGVALQTNSTVNGSQSVLNLIAGSNISLTDDGTGGITIASSQSSLIGSTSTLGTETWLGTASGSMASASHTDTVFIGISAGSGATNAANSVFIGDAAGSGATNSSNSIFIGKNAGLNDGNLNSLLGGTSILIGDNTSTGGNSDSIAIGNSAVNTAANQFMIGSSTSPIDSTTWEGSAATQCTITTGTGIACTSDERLKTNIDAIEDGVLSKILDTRAVTFNWLRNPNSDTQIGFLAQNLEELFPELVATDSDGYKSVYYAQMTPLLVKAIQEIDIKVVGIANLEIENTWRDSLIAWFGTVTNGITRLFAGEIETKNLCVSDEGGAKTCITKEQLDTLLHSVGR
ncbi:MAG: tail fiber domain-containing protein [Candidatus Pacebacteria bacterium]|nr:tail fiber domain-containing protein [Candidatus Paceibacterota bacterium]MBP9700998.1 tail fiber domain-containing protein [Candidatus Paceibacterota bacterium]